jgi:hypothetical protein
MLKKIKIFLLLITISVLLGASSVQAAAPRKTAQERCDAFVKMFQISNSKINAVEGLPKYCTASGLIMTLINISLIFAGTIAVLFIIVGGFWYMTSAGDEEQAEKGRKTLTNAVIGLVVIIMSFAIVRIVANTVTGGEGTGGTTPTTQNSGSNNSNNNSNNNNNPSSVDLLNAINFPNSVAPGSTALVVFSIKASTEGELANAKQAISEACAGAAFNNATFNISVNGVKAGSAKFTASNSGINSGVSVVIPVGQTETDLSADICGNFIANAVY